MIYCKAKVPYGKLSGAFARFRMDWRKMKNRMIIALLCVSLLFVIGGVRLYHKLNENPHLVAIQTLLDEEIGNVFRVVLEYQKGELIGEVVLCGDDELYMNPDIFSQVDQAQKLIYSYIMQHREAFDFVYTQYREDGMTESEFPVYFDNKDKPSGHETVFCFTCEREWESYHVDGFNCMLVNGVKVEGIEKQYYFSDMVSFTDIKAIWCNEIIIDDVDVLNQMKNLKKIDLWKVEGDVEQLQDKAKKLGVKVTKYPN